MAKWLKIVLVVLAISICITRIFSYISFYKDMSSLSVIGGEDGPTTIFLAGQLGNENSQTAIEETQETKNDSTQSINENNESFTKRDTINTEETESISEIDESQGSKEDIEIKEMSEEEIQYAINEKYYASWTENDMAEAMNERSPYYQKSAYYKEVSNYLENILEIRDITNVVEPIYYTDMKYYSADYFKDVPPLMIHIAKNEIYARHGYIFKNDDLYNYFMGCIWYNPTCSLDEFDDSIFNQYEKANLKLLVELDDYN